MNIPELPMSGPIPVPEDPKQYIVSVDVTVRAETALAAADRVADLGRRLTEDCDVANWYFRGIEPLNERAGRKGGAR